MGESWTGPLGRREQVRAAGQERAGQAGFLDGRGGEDRAAELDNRAARWERAG